MATTAEACISTVRANLHEVFEEADPQKRRQAIERLWSTSEECIFIDPDAVWRGHDRIDQCVSALVKKFAGWVFVETGWSFIMRTWYGVDADEIQEPRRFFRKVMGSMGCGWSSRSGGMDRRGR